MGFLDKVKNLFTEEVEEPIIRKEDKKHEMKREIQKQERTVEIAPARRESVSLLDEENIDEVSLPKREEKPLPIYFSDEDFADLETVKPEKKEENKKEFKEIKELYTGKKEEVKKEEKKGFKPSPIISPVYGILDKNYKKDDITTKEVTTTYKSDKVTVDDIRNKAYGTLEDELESNLLGSPIIIENNEEETNLDIFEELESREARTNKKDLLQEDYNEKSDLSLELERQKQQIEEINEIIKNTISPDKEKVTSRKIDNILEELDEIEEMIPAKEEQDISEDFTDESDDKKVIEEEIKEEYDDYEDDFEEEIDEDYEDIEENMNTSEEIEDTKDEIEESDLFNLIDSMYEKRDE